MENNEKKAMLHDALVLFAITLIAGLLLGFVYQLTKNPIEEQQKKAIAKACSVVFQNASSFEELEINISDDTSKNLEEKGVKIGKIFNALDANGSSLGHVIEAVSTQGYGGSITLYVGITKEGNLNGISILSISETPGLGMRAEEVLVPQFSDKHVDEFVYTKSGSTSDSEIDAISGATITTKAVVGAVNGALLVEKNDLSE